MNIKRGSSGFNIFGFYNLVFSLLFIFSSAIALNKPDLNLEKKMENKNNF